MELFRQDVCRCAALFAPGDRSLAGTLNLCGAFARLCCAGHALWFHAASWHAPGFSTDFLASPGFLNLCAVAGLYVVWLGYGWRVRWISRRIRDEWRCQLQQREKIAGASYDALLQSMQGILLRFQIVADRLAPLQRSRSALDDAMDRADDLIVEGRENVNWLRSTRSADLPGLLLELADGLATGPPVEVWMTVEGAPRDIQPTAHEAIKRIAGEALRNSFRHAQANNIEICVVYHPKRLIVQLRDDGVGLEQGELDRLEPRGCCGLSDMQARAHLLGGEYSISSRSNAGTMVQLTLPTEVAYCRVSEAAA